MKNTFDEKVALRLSRNKNTPTDVLKTFAGKSAKVDKLIAKHPYADAAVLDGLSGSNDETTIKYLLRNPSTPVETILAIASRFPDGCSKLLRDFFKSTDHEALAIRLARDKKISDRPLYMLLGLYTSVDRLIAKHPNASCFRMLGNLADSKDKATQRNVFFNPQSSGSTVARLVPEFPEEFLKHPRFEELVESNSSEILGLGQALLFQFLVRPECPQSLLNWACKRGGAYEQLAVWKNPSTPVELLTEMMVAGYPQEANVMLAHPAKALEFASDLGFVGTPHSRYKKLQRLNDWLMNKSFKVEDLWEKLRPKEGDTKKTVQLKQTVQLHMVFAIGQIMHDYCKNGWGNWDQMFYQYSQSLATHLIDENTFKPFTLSVLRADFRAMDACGQRCMYQGNLEQTFLGSLDDMEEVTTRISAAIVMWCERHPKPIPYESKN